MSELYKHQLDIIEKEPDHYGFWWGTGTGKTRTAIEIVKRKKGSTLIVCPKMLKENWKRELEKWRCCPSYLIVSKEEFRDKFMRHATKFDNLIIDEAHFFSNYQSKMGKSLAKYIDWSKPRVYLLTATPYLSTPWNIYTLAGYLGIKVSWGTFKRMCFYDIKMGNKFVPVVKNGIEPYLNSMLMDKGNTVVLEECFDVPPQIDETVYVDLTKEQQHAKDVVTEWEYIIRFTRYHTIENGVQYISENHDEKTYYPNEKIDYIKNLATEKPKIAVVCRYNLQIEEYAKALQNDGYSVFIINGDVPNRQEVIDQVNQSDKAIVLIQAQCSEGYELPTIDTCVFASLSFSYKDYKQMRGRFLRANALKKNIYIHLVVNGGIDDEVYKAIKRKQDFSFELLTNKN